MNAIILPCLHFTQELINFLSCLWFKSHDKTYDIIEVEQIRAHVKNQPVLILTFSQVLQVIILRGREENACSVSEALQTFFQVHDTILHCLSLQCLSEYKI